MKITARDRIMLKPLEDIIDKYMLGTLPTTDTAKQLFHELDADELMSVLDKPAIYDADLLQRIKMTATEFRQAQEQALYLHVMLEAESILGK